MKAKGLEDNETAKGQGYSSVHEGNERQSSGRIILIYGLCILFLESLGQ